MTERFTLLTELGRGGMGVVWKARDEESGQIVALKLLRETYAEDPDYVTRFERELELAKRIDSVHIVKVLGFGVRGNVPYLALEYVDGPSLHQTLVARGPYSWPEARALLVQIAQGLADANAAQVVHRDVKPSNVLIGPDGIARLTDFGIARGLDLTRFTATSTFLGTPAYLAPEGPKDARSDLYSLGIIGYELLTGAVPFIGTSYQEVIVEHIRTAPDLAKLPKEARRIIGWLLAKNPDKRPQSAAELLAALGGSRTVPALAGSGRGPASAMAAATTLAANGAASIIQPATGRRHSTGHISGRPPTRRRRTTLALGGFVALALAFASVLTLLAVLPAGATRAPSLGTSDVGNSDSTASSDSHATLGEVAVGPNGSAGSTTTADSSANSIGSGARNPTATVSSGGPTKPTPAVSAGATAPAAVTSTTIPTSPTAPPVTLPPVTAAPVTAPPVTPAPVTAPPVAPPPPNVVAPPPATTTYASVSGGAYHTCAITTAGTLACWGDNTYGQSAPPPGVFNSVMAGANHNCAVRSNGAIACWGDNRYGQSNAPTGTFSAVYPGDRHTCALSGSSIKCWGDNSAGQATVPPGTYSAMSAGGSHTCGMQTNGILICWGDNSHGQNDVPPGMYNFVRVAPQHTCAEAGTTLVCWGNGAYGQTTPPAANLMDVGRGADHTCGLTYTSTIACWGRNDYGQATAPSGTFSKVGGGWYHTCAIKADNKMFCWGLNDHGQAPQFI